MSFSVLMAFFHEISVTRHGLPPCSIQHCYDTRCASGFCEAKSPALTELLRRSRHVMNFADKVNELE